MTNFTYIGYQSKEPIVGKKWLSDQDLNLDKVNQNHLCCHYTIGQNMHL